ncbi:MULTISPECIES: methyltransferase [unclassified Marinovum]
MHDGTRTPSPRNVMDLATAYWRSQALFAANRLGLFETLTKAQSAPDLAASLGCNLRVLQMLLDALVGQGLLERQDTAYATSDEARMFLVPGQPGYMGNAIHYAENLYSAWGGLGKTLTTGEPEMAFEVYTGDDPRQTREFVYAMHDRALGIAAAMVDLVDLRGAATLLDVGGGPGTYASMFVQANPGLRATVLDLPGVVAHLPDIMARLGTPEAVTGLPGDFHAIDFPKGQNAVLISGVLHRESGTFCQELIARAKATLNPGGKLILADVFLRHEDEASRAFAPLFGLNMALTAPDGCVHDLEDICRWMTAAGFGGIETAALPPPLPHSLAIGQLP